MLALMFSYALLGGRLVDEDFDELLGRHILLNYITMGFIFLAAIGIASFSPSAAKYFWLVIWADSFVLKRINRRARRAREGA